MKFDSSFLRDYFKRGGAAVILSTAVVKIVSVLLSLLVVRLMTKDEYAILTFVLSVYSILIVIVGLGGNYSLLRFGSITDTIKIRFSYFRYTMKYGFILSLIIVPFVIIYSFLIPENLIEARIPIWISIIAVFSFFFLETLRSYFRILNLNKVYSIINIWNSILMLVLTPFLTWQFQVYGYVLSLILAAVITFFYFYRHIPRTQLENVDFNKRKYWSYGVNTSIGGIANQMIFSIAPILLGFLHTDNHAIASFKVATIIPFALLTLPGILMISDFSYLSRSYLNGDVLRNYYKNYLKLVMPTSTVVFIILLLFRKQVILFFFGADYLDCIPMYVCFMIATYLTYIMRNPLGNILLAIGKADWNAYSAYFFCAFYVILTIIIFPYFNYWSAVISLCLTFVISGFVSFYLYSKYLKSIG